MTPAQSFLLHAIKLEHLECIAQVKVLRQQHAMELNREGHPSIATTVKIELMTARMARVQQQMDDFDSHNTPGGTPDAPTIP